MNGTSLARGLISLITLLAFQLVSYVCMRWRRLRLPPYADASSQISSHYGKTLENAINSPPLVIAFRGRPLEKVMRNHRVSRTDLNGALRRANVWHISEVEAVIIEPTGSFSIYKRADRPEGVEPDVLLDVPGYRRLVEHFDEKKQESVVNLVPGEKRDGKLGTDREVERARDAANDIAADEA